MSDWEEVKITYDGKHYKMNSLKGLAVQLEQGEEFKIKIKEQHNVRSRKD